MPLCVSVGEERVGGGQVRGITNECGLWATFLMGGWEEKIFADFAVEVGAQLREICATFL